MSNFLSSDKTRPSPVLSGKDVKNSFRFNLKPRWWQNCKRSFSKSVCVYHSKERVKPKNLTCSSCFMSSPPSPADCNILGESGSLLFKERCTHVWTLRKHQDRVCLWSDMKFKSPLLLLMMFWRKSGGFQPSCNTRHWEKLQTWETQRVKGNAKESSSCHLKFKKNPKTSWIYFASQTRNKTGVNRESASCPKR